MIQYVHEMFLSEQTSVKILNSENPSLIATLKLAVLQPSSDSTVTVLFILIKSDSD